MERLNNRIRLCGNVTGRPVLSHAVRNEVYYRFPLSVQRLSGTEDILNVLTEQRQLDALSVSGGSRLFISGEVRSFNNRSGIGPKLVISVLAREMQFTDGEFENVVTLSGALCKAPVLRRTPMGREICDLMLAVNRPYGRSDYLPCIAWGAVALSAGRLTVGAEVSLTGRLQSRSYIKILDSTPVERVAYEISVLTLS